MTLDTVFWIASMTKAITSVAAMQLVEQGRIGLDQPLDSVVPKLANPQVMDGFDADGQPRLRPARRSITLHDLLTHIAGFVYEMWNGDISRYLKGDGAARHRTGLNAALEQPLAFDPGARWEYGINTDWVGKVVEAVSGQTLGCVFRRAHHRAARHGGHAVRPPRFGPGRHDSPPRPAGSLEASSSGRPAKPELESGGGGLFSTGPDYLKFLTALLQGGGVLLRPETVALMGRNHDRRAGGRPDADDDPGRHEHGFVLPGHGQALGLRLPDQHGSRACRAQRGQPGLGRAGELLLLARPGAQRRRAGDDADPALADPAALAVLDSFESAIYAAPGRIG